MKDKQKLLREKFNEYTQERFESEFKERLKDGYVYIVTKDNTMIYTDKYKFNYLNNRISLYSNGKYIASIKLEEISKVN